MNYIAITGTLQGLARSDQVSKDSDEPTSKRAQSSGSSAKELIARAYPWHIKTLILTRFSWLIARPPVSLSRATSALWGRTTRA